VSVIEALEYRRNRFDGVASCTKNETLGVIMERIVNKEVNIFLLNLFLVLTRKIFESFSNVSYFRLNLKVHRLVVVDEQNRVTGVISLSDILTYIVLKCDNRTKPPPYQIDHVTSNKTASLTQAFGLTRLSTSHDHVILNESSSSHTGEFTINQQPLMSNNDHGTIFEDDPMETEQQQPQNSVKLT
jgi:hypothetical protein